MLFTVVIPVYNGEKYIRDCINSVLNQTEKSFEIIVINDGSIDNSLSIIQEFRKKDSRIRIINQENKGLLQTRRIAIEQALGQFMISLDADDKLKVNALEIIKKHIINSKVDVVIYRAERLSASEKTNEMKKVFKNNTIFEGNNKRFLYEKILVSSDLNSMCFKAIKRDCFDFDEIKSYPKVKNGEDLLHTLPVITSAKKVIYIEDVLYSYRINDESMTRKFDADSYKGTLFIFNILFKYLEIWKMNDSYNTSVFYKRYLESIGNLVLYSPSKVSNKELMGYKKIVTDIRTSTMFSIAYKNSFKNLSVVYKVPMWLIKHEKSYVLYNLKKVVSILRR